MEIYKNLEIHNQMNLLNVFVLPLQLSPSIKTTFHFCLLVILICTFPVSLFPSTLTFPSKTDLIPALFVKCIDIDDDNKGYLV